MTKKNCIGDGNLRVKFKFYGNYKDKIEIGRGDPDKYELCINIGRKNETVLQRRVKNEMALRCDQTCVITREY